MPIIPLSQITFDEDIYPRRTKSNVTIDSYVEALKGGAEFPPLTVQKVQDNGTVLIVSLDGLHRYKAYSEFNKLEDVTPIKEVEVDYYKEGVLDKQEYLEELLKVSAKLNRKHGIRLSDSDLEFQCLKILRNRKIDNIRGIKKELADYYEITESAISQWETFSKEYNRRLASRDSLILKLDREGWTDKEIGEVVGLERSVVTKNVQNLSTKVLHIKSNFKQEKKVEELAEFHNLETIPVWSIVLEDKTDIERFDLFIKNKKEEKRIPKIYNVWNFSNCDPRLGIEHPGRIPGQIIMNLLYYYTKQGDLVVDPMAGGGSTIDSCLVMNRRCRAYDISPKRKDIIERDLKDGYDPRCKNADFIFLDPPYWNLLNGKYVNEEGEIPENCVADWTIEKYLEFMKDLAKQTFSTIKTKGKVALIIQAIEDERGSKTFYDLPFICNQYFIEAGFKQIQRISVPISTQVKSGRDVNFVKKNEKMLSINRDLIIYERFLHDNES